MIKWRLIRNSEAFQNWANFLQWFVEGRPHIFLIGVGLVSIIEKIGLDTFDKRKAVFQEIVENYHLGDILKLDVYTAYKV
jgi:hypothetical protein